MIPDQLKLQRNVGLWFTLDANRINARQLDSEMNQLEKWYDDGVIDLIISEPASVEALKRGSPKRFAKARRYFHSQTLISTTEERRDLKKIANVLLGREPKDSNERNDVEILFNTKKYAGYLITEDGASRSQPLGILGARVQLKTLGIEVYRTREAVELVRKRIRNRDIRAREYSSEYNAPIPDWVGKD